MKQFSTNPNSVEKALQILTAFLGDRSVWGVRELGAHLGFSPATVQRLLQILKHYGFVEQDDRTRQYRLGNIHYRFVHTLQSQHPLVRIALPVMQALVSVTHETVHLNIIQGIERVCIDSIESSMDLKASMPVGNRSPLYAGASSKCLLAFSTDTFIDHYLQTAALTPLSDRTVTDPGRLRKELREIRRNGYAASMGERIVGLGSLSAPIIDHRGFGLAAVSLAIPEIRYMEEAHLKFCLTALLQAAERLSIRMGYHPSGDSVSDT